MLDWGGRRSPPRSRGRSPWRRRPCVSTGHIAPGPTICLTISSLMLSSRIWPAARAIAVSVSSMSSIDEESAVDFADAAMLLSVAVAPPVPPRSASWSPTTRSRSWKIGFTSYRFGSTGTPLIACRTSLMSCPGCSPAMAISALTGCVLQSIKVVLAERALRRRPSSAGWRSGAHAGLVETRFSSRCIGRISETSLGG